MTFRDAIESVGAGSVTKFPDPPPNPGDKARQWGEILKNLRGGAPGEEIKPGPAPHEEVHPVPREELHQIS